VSDDMQRMLDLIRFHEIARQEAKRTILCEPHREHQIRAAVDQAGAADILTVRASPACPQGQLLILDTGALDAWWDEWAQRLRLGYPLD
jgi:hypothetical protein